MRGRKPNYKTLATLEAESPMAPVRVPPCPATVKGEAAREWKRVTALLRSLGLVAQLDRAALAIYCLAWQRWTEAEANLANQGVVVKSPNGYPIQNPFLSVSNQAAKQMQSLLAEFGLSPAARRRLIETKKEKKKPEETGWEGTLANVVG